MQLQASSRKFFYFLRTWMSARRLADFVFGYDFFISYKQDDGHQYPRGLAGALGKEGFKVFLDESGFSAGDDLLLNTRRRVRMSSYLLLIGRPGALTRSDWVVREVEQCLQAHNVPIVVDIDDCFSTVQASSADEAQRLSRLRRLLVGRLRITETTGAAAGMVFDGAPSEHMLRELKRSFAGRRQDSRRARVFGAAAVLFGILALAAAGLATASVLAQHQAERQTRRSRAGELAAQARLIRERQPQLSNLLASEAVAVVQSAGEPVPATARQALVEAVVGSTGEGIPGNGVELGALDISPDGRWWALGGDDGSLQLREMKADGALAPAATVPHAGTLNVRFAAFSAASDWLVTAGDGGEGCMWSLSKLKNLQCLAMAPSETLYDAKISPDRRWIAAAGLANTVLLWDLSKPDPQNVIEIGRGLTSARNVRFSADGHGLIAWGINNHDAWFWNLTGSPLPRNPDVLHHQADVAEAAIDAKNGRLASIDETGRVALWQQRASHWGAAELKATSNDPVVVNGLVFSLSGAWLAAAIAPGQTQDEAGSSLYVWQLSPQGQPIQSKTFPLDGQVRGLDFSPGDRMLYVEGLNGKLWVLGIANGLTAGPMSLSGHLDTVTQHDFSPDARFLVTGDNDRAVLLWDFACKPTPPAPIALVGHEAIIRALRFGPGADWLVSASNDGTARRWNMARTLPGDALTLARACDSDLAAAAISSNRAWLASGTENGSVLLIDLTADDPSIGVRQLRNDDHSSIADLWFDPTNRWLVAENKSETLDVWDLRARPIESSRRHLKRLNRSAGAIGFLPDGRRIVTRAAGGTALIVDLTQDDPDASAVVLSIPGQEIDDVFLSRDGRWLAATAYDHMFLWDLSQPSGAAPVALPPFDAFVSRVRFTGDSGRLMVVDNSGNMRVWSLPMAYLQNYVAFSVADRSSDIVFSKDDRWMAVTTSVVPHLKIFPMTDHARPPLPVVPKEAAEGNGSIAFSGDGVWLAYASDKALQLWKTSQLDQPPWVLGAPSRIEQLNFSEDGHWLAFGSDRGDVSVAEMAPQGPLDSFSVRSHRGSIRFLDFGPHGRSLISESYNGLRLTPLGIPNLLELADERTGRNFQGLEWDTYFHTRPYRTTFSRLPSLAGKGSP